MGGSGECERVAVEKANDINVIPQRECRASTATRSLLHLPSSAPSTTVVEVGRRRVRRVTGRPA
ncbi:hypothetical protein HMPREF1549_00224 [Actinomyces johnsonii F0510]|uniref:Uncharacterized protein n=1 Tax=Actinomyces johnsonii F0510 TaxID=1227262 RepID=U1Q5M5_9ACTO|nr:hypothetical protein HMPREF1549_00224 [Actinomyces johnsonii F0510]